MNFFVEWKKTATDELAEIWLNADSPERGRVTASASEIDRLLHLSPGRRGESRDGGRRIMFVAPLAASFRVLPAIEKVEVLRIWRFRSR